MRHIYMNRLDTQESDESLVADVLAGNREAFSILASRYYTSVLQLCIRLLNDPVQAEDIAQEAILQAFLGLDRLQQHARFGAWLHAIAANLARSSLRRLQTLSLDGLQSSVLQRRTSFPDLEQIVALREIHDAILAALMELSIVNREAVIGYYLQGYSYMELANLLGVPVSTVKSRLFKGRQQMRQQLEGLRQPVRIPPIQIEKEFPMTPELIPLQIEMICEYALTRRSIVVLRMLTGDRYLPIQLLPEEAVAIERALKRQPDVLPVTHQDTLLQLVSRLGGRIEQIVIRSLVEQNYYASLVLSQDDQRYEINCRLSDALMLAVRAQILILVTPALLKEAGFAIEPMNGDAVDDLALRDAPEPVSTSDRWPDTFVEQVWSFLLSVLYKNRKPYDLSRLQGITWNEFFSPRKFSWEQQTMQVLQLPGPEPAWLVVRPELWTQIMGFVEWVQHRDTHQAAEPQPSFVPLNGDRQKQIEELFEGVWPAMTTLGARTLALMHLSGQLVAGRSLDGYEAAVRMGRAAVKDLVLTKHFNALVHAEAEPSIRITYERSTTFNPAQAADMISSSETLIHEAWLFVIGWKSDQQGNEQQSFPDIQANLEALLPA